ncbi:MAG: TIGR00645 family protein [Sphingomonadales bacterium]|nr:TIGR00645 family protein [Sphingomonadales bacterium]
MEKAIERVLFASRWLMAPMYLGLVGALTILLWAFLMELWHFASGLPDIGVDEAVMGALALIDLSLAANLIIIVIFSGYENFVSRMDTAHHEDRPDWQGEVDFSTLKLKLVASIVAISGIHLLKIFMILGAYPAEKIRWMVIIHLVFVISGVLLAAMDWISNHAKSLKKSAKYGRAEG